MDLETPPFSGSPPGPQRRRRHPRAFKEQVVAESDAPGASVAGVAMRHGINPNLLHKWRRTPSLVAQKDFVRLPAPISEPNIAPTTVRMEVPTPKGTLVVHWPLTELPQSVTWLRALTR